MKIKSWKLIIPGLCLLFTGFSCFTSCEKVTPEDLIGTWISVDLADTIEFTTGKDLYKLFSGVRDHFDYTLGDDKIKIGYSGMLYILITPTSHEYKFKNELLTIDFRPGCYGFRSQEITFKRQ